MLEVGLGTRDLEYWVYTWTLLSLIPIAVPTGILGETPASKVPILRKLSCSVARTPTASSKPEAPRPQVQADCIFCAVAWAVPI